MCGVHFVCPIKTSTAYFCPARVGSSLCLRMKTSMASLREVIGVFICKSHELYYLCKFLIDGLVMFHTVS